MICVEGPCVLVTRIKANCALSLVPFPCKKLGCSQCEQILQNFATLGEIWQFLRGYFVFGNTLYVLGNFFVSINGQNLANIQAIWSHLPVVKQ